MRRLAGTAVAALALLTAAPAAAHPGHGATFVDIKQFAFTPADVTIAQGDSVLWTWMGPDTNHSVTSDPGQAMSFDSDPGKSPATVAHKVNDGYSVTFSEVGTFSYHCKVHVSMTGRVTVQPAPPPATTPAPTLSKVSVKPKGFKRKTTLRFSVDGPVTIRAMLRKRGKLVKELDFDSPPGDHSRRLNFGKARPGKYVLKVVAVDTSSGNSSKPVSVAVVLK
jgi:plastocyanin